MSLLSAAFPLQAALPAAEVIAGSAMAVARPALGLGVLAVFALMFKPLLIGLLRAALLVVKPRQSIEQRIARRNMKDLLLLNRLAHEVEACQPNLAVELRNLAARD